MFLFRVTSLPLVRVMFWTDWGDSRAGIYRSDMDGSSARCLVSEGVRWPNGISVDDHWIYWTEAYMDRIERVDFNGLQRSVILDSLPHPYAIAVFKVCTRQLVSGQCTSVAHLPRGRCVNGAGSRRAGLEGGSRCDACSVPAPGMFPQSPETGRLMKPGPTSQRHAAFPRSCTALSSPSCFPLSRCDCSFHSCSNPSSGLPPLPPLGLGRLCPVCPGG